MHLLYGTTIFRSIQPFFNHIGLYFVSVELEMNEYSNFEVKISVHRGESIKNSFLKFPTDGVVTPTGVVRVS